MPLYLPGYDFTNTAVKATEGETFELPTTVKAANELFSRFPVRDAGALFKTIPANAIELLYQDFLRTHGSTAGKRSLPRSSFDSSWERIYRLGIFAKSISTIFEKNAFAQAHAQRPDHARFGITVHADWTHDEFLSLFQDAPSANGTEQAGEPIAAEDAPPANGTEQAGEPIAAEEMRSRGWRRCATAIIGRTISRIQARSLRST